MAAGSGDEPGVWTATRALLTLPAMASPAGMAFNDRILNVLWYGSPGGTLVLMALVLAPATEGRLRRRSMV
jgi:hypothetical protein